MNGQHLNLIIHDCEVRSLKLLIRDTQYGIRQTNEVFGILTSHELLDDDLPSVLRSGIFLIRSQEFRDVSVFMAETLKAREVQRERVLADSQTCQAEGNTEEHVTLNPASEVSAEPPVFEVCVKPLHVAPNEPVDKTFSSIVDLRKEITDLRIAGEYDKAIAKVKTVRDLLPEDDWPYLELAWLTRHARDWTAAVAAAAECRCRIPKNETGYMVGVAALRSLGEWEAAGLIVDEASRVFGTKSWLLLERAESAFSTKQASQCIRFWKEFLALEPDNEHGYRRASQISVALSQWDEAETFLKAATRNLPEPSWAYVQLARNSMLKGDYNSAEHVLLLGVEAMPSDRQLQLELAVSSASATLDANRDVEKSLRRLKLYRSKFPDDADGWVTEIQMLRRANMLERAKALAAEALEAFPKCDPVLVESARLQGASGDPAEAVDILRKMANSHPESFKLQLEFARSLVAADFVQHAGEILSVYRKKWPQSADLERLVCVVGSKTLPFSQALDRWIGAAARFPADAAIADGLYAMRMSEGEQTQTYADQRSGDAAVNEFRGSAHRSGELFSQFESLGGTGQGCEFGLVQRRSGIEPLGLLRWTNITFDNLTRGLNEDFDGVGSPEQTKLELFGGARQADDPEYVSIDCRYGIRMHTFIHKCESGEDRLSRQIQRRLTFLRRKLLEELKSGEKIYVFKQSNYILSENELDELVAALGRHGENRLLYVRYADDGNRPGTAILLKKNLIVGYISQFSMAPSGEARPPLMDEWTSICEQAAALAAPAFAAASLADQNAYQETGRDSKENA